MPARQVKCQNNLKQISLALHSSHDANDKFPENTWRVIVYPQSVSTNWTWHLLPYLEQENLHRRTDQVVRPMLRPTRVRFFSPFDQSVSGIRHPLAGVCEATFTTPLNRIRP